MKVSKNENKKTTKTEQVILNWFYSTGTLQVQGPQAANFKGFLTKSLGAESNNENAILRPSQHNASSKEANLTFADNPETERFPHETVPFSVFTEEIKNIWSEIKAIRKKHPRRKRRSSRSTKSSSNGEDSHSGANNNNERARKPVTVIAGDSIIQHIRGWSISRSNQVVVKSFPGATTEDIEDFVKPLLRKKPDNVFLHIGTNDLNTQEPRLTVEGIVNLALQIEGDAPETNLAISGLIARADDKDVKVSSVNKIFKKFCRQNHWNFIEHNNINQTHLNRGGLHLSKSGSALLAQNFCKYID